MIFLKILGYIWAAPASILGLLVAVFYQPRALRLHQGGVEFITKFVLPGWAAAQTWGWVVIYDASNSQTWAEVSPRSILHEHRHIAQALIFGPLMPVVYIGASLWALLRGGHYYKDNYFERDARRAAGQEP